MPIAMRLVFIVLCSAAFAAPAFAENVRVRATIEQIDGRVLHVKDRGGEKLRVRLADGARVTGLKKISLADIEPGTFVGSAAVPSADGNLIALEVHLFPESMRGTGEGHRPFDLQPNSTMTNATVSDAVMGKDGKTLTVKYKGGEKKIVVPPAAPVVTYVPGSVNDLKPGVQIVVSGGMRAADGTIEASRVNYGQDGLTPPM